MKNLLIVFVVIASFCLGFAFSSAMTILPKDISTVSTLIVLEREIRNFFAEKHRLPITLSELVEMGKVEECECKDRWGNKIGYILKNSNTVSLVSRGDPSITSYKTFEYLISNTFSIRQGQSDEK